jgi:26S proteasome regulatory subunit T3
MSSIIQAAGMFAVRANRYVVLAKDLEKAYVSNVKKPDMDLEFYR